MDAGRRREKNRLRTAADSFLTRSSLPAGVYTPLDGDMVAKRAEGEDDERPAVSANKYVASILAAKETGNNKRTGSEEGE